MTKKRDWRWQRDAGLSLIITTLIFMCLPIWGAFASPDSIYRHWDVYLLFVLLPLASGIVLVVLGRRSQRRQ